jgi:hypothetical protein
MEDRWHIRLNRVRKAFSFRGVWFAGVVSIVVVAISDSALLGWVVFGLIWLGYVVNDDYVARCSYCYKLVKLGAESCHHCGRQVTKRVARGRR